METSLNQPNTKLRLCGHPEIAANGEQTATEKLLTRDASGTFSYLSQTATQREKLRGKSQNMAATSIVSNGLSDHLIAYRLGSYNTLVNHPHAFRQHTASLPQKLSLNNKQVSGLPIVKNLKQPIQIQEEYPSMTIVDTAQISRQQSEANLPRETHGGRNSNASFQIGPQGIQEVSTLQQSTDFGGSREALPEKKKDKSLYIMKPTEVVRKKCQRHFQGAKFGQRPQPLSSLLTKTVRYTPFNKVNQQASRHYDDSKTIQRSDITKIQILTQDARKSHQRSISTAEPSQERHSKLNMSKIANKTGFSCHETPILTKKIKQRSDSIAQESIRSTERTIQEDKKFTTDGILSRKGLPATTVEETSEYISLIQAEVDELRLEKVEAAEKILRLTESLSGMKNLNKTLLEQLHALQVPMNLNSQPDDYVSLEQPRMKQIEQSKINQDSYLHSDHATIQNGSQMESQMESQGIPQHEISKIHSLYQDLYLTDIKQDLDNKELDLRQEKERAISKDNLIRKLRLTVEDLQKKVIFLRGQISEQRRSTATSKQGLGRSQVQINTYLGEEPEHCDTPAMMDHSEFANDFRTGEVHDERLETESVQRSSQVKMRKKQNAGQTNYNLVCDLVRLDRLYNLSMEITTCKQTMPLFCAVLKDISQVITCQQCTIYFFDEDICKGPNHHIKVPTGLNFSKVVFENKYIDVLAKEDEEITDPQFSSLKKGSVPNKTIAHMSYPIFDNENQLIMIIQIMQRQKKVSILKQKFSSADETLFMLLGQIMQAKLLQLVGQKIVGETRREVIQTLQLACEISTQRNQMDLLQAIRKFLPGYLGFEGVGIMFRDTKHGGMFSVKSCLDDSEIKDEEEFIEKKRQGIPLNQEDRLKEFERQHKRCLQQRFGQLSGATGQAFISGKIIWTNDMKKLPAYLDSIDNLTETSTVPYNYICVPLFGFPDSHAEKGQQEPFAALQVVNKVNRQTIDENDLVSSKKSQSIQQKLQKLSDMLGRSVDNASKHHAVISMLIGHSQKIGLFNGFIEMSEDVHDRGLRDSLNKQIETTAKARKAVGEIEKNVDLQFQELLKITT